MHESPGCKSDSYVGSSTVGFIPTDVNNVLSSDAVCHAREFISAEGHAPPRNPTSAGSRRGGRQRWRRVADSLIVEGSVLILAVLAWGAVRRRRGFSGGEADLYEACAACHGDDGWDRSGLGSGCHSRLHVVPFNFEEADRDWQTSSPRGDRAGGRDHALLSRGVTDERSSRCRLSPDFCARIGRAGTEFPGSSSPKSLAGGE